MICEMSLLSSEFVCMLQNATVIGDVEGKQIVSPITTHKGDACSQIVSPIAKKGDTCGRIASPISTHIEDTGI